MKLINYRFCGYSSRDLRWCENELIYIYIYYTVTYLTLYSEKLGAVPMMVMNGYEPTYVHTTTSTL